MSSISNKLLFGFIVILLVSLLIAGVVGIFLVNNMVTTNLQQDVGHDLDAAEVIYLYELTHIEEAVVYTSGFSRLRDPLINNDPVMLRKEIVNIYDEWFRYELDILTVTDKNGIVVARARNPALYGDPAINNTLIKYALNGVTVSSTEIISREELLKESEYLASQAYMDFTPTPKAKYRPETNSSSGMVLITAAPIYDDGNIIGVLYGADLLNRDYKIVDKIKSALYEDETYIGRDVGTATIFQEDFRIATNVPTDTGERAITTRLSQEVTEAVLEKGDNWKDRAFVVNEGYVTAYKPIRNFDNEIIGILYVGILEKPYIDAQYDILQTYLIFLVFGFLISVVMARYYGKALTKPINKLIKGTEAISKGEYKKIDVGTEDEIGKLADAFNDMSVELHKTIGELISSKNEIAAIFESMSDVASAQDKNMKIIFANKQAKKIYGESILGRFCYDIYEGKSEKCEDCPGYKSLETGEVMRTLYSKVDPKGLVNHYEITGSPLRNEHNNIIGTLIIRRDVTEQKKLEDQIKDSYKTLDNAFKELQKMDQIKSELVANVFHEIRTPLTSIKGYTELMLDDSLGPITDMQRKSLAIMLRNIDRLSRL
ncbi:MAG: HAMP domain-containing protein, partial [ANME-2 cluster archaeon]